MNGGKIGGDLPSHARYAEYSSDIEEAKMTSLANIFEIESSEREREERVTLSHRVHIRLIDEGRWRGTAEQDANHNGPRMANRTGERFHRFFSLAMLRNR